MLLLLEDVAELGWILQPKTKYPEIYPCIVKDIFGLFHLVSRLDSIRSWMEESSVGSIFVRWIEKARRLECGVEAEIQHSSFGGGEREEERLAIEGR